MIKIKPPTKPINVFLIIFLISSFFIAIELSLLTNNAYRVKSKEIAGIEIPKDIDLVLYTPQAFRGSIISLDGEGKLKIDSGLLCGSYTVLFGVKIIKLSFDDDCKDTEHLLRHELAHYFFDTHKELQERILSRYTDWEAFAEYMENCEIKKAEDFEKCL